MARPHFGRPLQLEAVPTWLAPLLEHRGRHDGFTPLALMGDSAPRSSAVPREIRAARANLKPGASPDHTGYKNTGTLDSKLI